MLFLEIPSAWANGNSHATWRYGLELFTEWREPFSHIASLRGSTYFFVFSEINGPFGFHTRPQFAWFRPMPIPVKPGLHRYQPLGGRLLGSPLTADSPSIPERAGYESRHVSSSSMSYSRFRFLLFSLSRRSSCSGCISLLFGLAVVKYFALPILLILVRKESAGPRNRLGFLLCGFIGSLGDLLSLRITTLDLFKAESCALF